MKKVKFSVDADELVVELPDNYTEEDICKTFQAWLDSIGFFRMVFHRRMNKLSDNSKLSDFL